MCLYRGRAENDPIHSSAQEAVSTGPLPASSNVRTTSSPCSQIRGLFKRHESHYPLLQHEQIRVLESWNTQRAKTSLEKDAFAALHLLNHGSRVPELVEERALGLAP